MEMDLITCKECNIHKSITKFYRVIKEKLIDNKYQPFVICKDCIKKEYLLEYEKVNNDFRQALIITCTKYNIYYDENLMQSIKENNIEDGWNLFQQYIKYISSLPQYNGLKYKDSVWSDKNIHTKTGISEDIIENEKSDLDFINDDIKQLKKNIEKAIQKEDFNAHNKWMNCLRDAIELRETLKGVNKYTINLGTVNVNSNSAEDLINELTQIAKKQVNCK